MNDRGAPCTSSVVYSARVCNKYNNKIGTRLKILIKAKLKIGKKNRVVHWAWSIGVVHGTVHEGGPRTGGPYFVDSPLWNICFLRLLTRA